MSSPRSLSPTQALFDAAKGDAPDAATRAKMWSGVSDSIAVSPGVSGVAAGTTSASKLLAMGTLLGASAVVGLAATVLYVGAARPGHWHLGRVAAAAPALRATATAFATAGSSFSVSPPLAEVVAIRNAGGSNSTETVAPPPNPLRGPMAHPAAKRRLLVPAEDALWQEAALMSTASMALTRHDAQAALSALHSVRLLPSRQLEPEGLAIEAQALRMLGRIREAEKIEGILKSSYPLSELIRAR